MKQQPTIKKRIAKNINSALEVIPRALHIDVDSDRTRSRRRKSARSTSKRAKAVGAHGRRSSLGASSRSASLTVSGRKRGPKKITARVSGTGRARKASVKRGPRVRKQQRTSRQAMAA